MEKIAGLQDFSHQYGYLYIVATPIGNLDDITFRAIKILKSVDYIYAEDTRHSEKLISHYGIKSRLKSLHDHNERNQSEKIIDLLKSGNHIAIISDAGTPLISDPGYWTVYFAKQHGIRVIPIPGPSALIAALSASGIACHHFSFEGFLPVKIQAREQTLKLLESEKRTLIFYEAPHRILATIESMRHILGEARQICLAKELTKQFEKIILGTLAEIYSLLQNNPHMQQGEFVIIVSAKPEIDEKEDDLLTNKVNIEPLALLKELIPIMPLKQACQLAEKMTGIGKNYFYKAGLKFKS